MEEKRVYTQSELIKVLNSSRNDIKFLMYEKGINISTHYCPWRKNAKSGYLLNVKDLNQYKMELSIKRINYYKTFIIVQNRNSKKLFFIEVGSERMLADFNDWIPILYIETNFLDIEAAFFSSVEGWNLVSLDKLKEALKKLDVKYIEFKR